MFLAVCLRFRFVPFKVHGHLVPAALTLCIPRPEPRQRCARRLAVSYAGGLGSRVIQVLGNSSFFVAGIPWSVPGFLSPQGFAGDELVGIPQGLSQVL
jgi:hypothetical protein